MRMTQTQRSVWRFVFVLLMGIIFCETRNIKAEENSRLQLYLQQKIRSCERVRDQSYQIDLARWNTRFPGEKLSDQLPEFLRELAIRCPNITHLILSENNLESIPDEIAAFQKLEYLGLHGNQLTQVPSQLEQLPNLKTVTLYGNRIRHIPFWARKFFINANGQLAFNIFTTFWPPTGWKGFKKTNYREIVESLGLIYLARNAVLKDPSAMKIPIQNLPLDIQEVLFSDKKQWASTLPGVIYVIEEIEKVSFRNYLPLVFGKVKDGVTVFTQDEMRYLKKLSRYPSDFLLGAELDF